MRKIFAGLPVLLVLVVANLSHASLLGTAAEGCPAGQLSNSATFCEDSGWACICRATPDDPYDTWNDATSRLECIMNKGCQWASPIVTEGNQQNLCDVAAARSAPGNTDVWCPAPECILVDGSTESSEANLPLGEGPAACCTHTSIFSCMVD